MNVYPKNASLRDIMNSLPGIYDVYCDYNFKIMKPEPIKYFFYVSDESDEGLFLITRCVDRRYWIYGNKWNIKLSVGDTYTSKNKRPISYILSSGDVIGKEAITQMYDLIDNINHHLNNRSFELGFELDKEKFRNNYIYNLRQEKIKKIRFEKILNVKNNDR